MVSCDSIESGWSDHVRRPIQDDQVAPPIMMDYTPDHEDFAVISVSWRNVGIH